MTAHPISIEMLEEGHLLLLGTTGAGKTYQQRGFLERLRRADRRVGAVDKLGNHWGLTLSADGQSHGLDFIIFGGKRAQVPMLPHQGHTLGRLFVTRNIPAIFDVSQWKADEQLEWMEGFADAVFLHNEGALHLGLDEAQSWVPQGGGGDAFKSVLRLAEQGRGNGIHLMLACQRWSRLDASVRAMTDNVIVAMRQTSPIDRAKIAELIAGSKAQRAEIEEALPGLKNGEGFIWEPRSGAVVRHVFPPNTTFDSSRTPRHGDAPPAPIAVSSALVDELRQALAPSPAANLPDDTIPSDPAEAYKKGGVVGTMIVERDRRIARLEGELADARAELEQLRGVDAECERYSKGLSAIDELVFALQNGSPIMHPRDANLHSPDANSANSTPPTPSAPAPAHPAPAAKGAAAPARAAAPDREYRSLAVLATIYPAGLTESAWASRAGRARKGGAWSSQRARYSKASLIEKRDDRWFATAAGVEAAGADIPALPQPGEQLVEWWADRIGRAGRLLRILFKKRGLTRAALAAEAGMTATGGAFTSAVGELKRAELIEENGKRLRIAPSLTGETHP
jgi:hypothetical protein